MAFRRTKLSLFAILSIVGLTLSDGKLRRPRPAVFDFPSNDSPFVALTVPTNVPKFYSTHYLDNANDQEEKSVTKPGSSGDVTRRRSANPPEVRCVLNRTSASLCQASGTPIGCACDKLCHGRLWRLLFFFKEKGILG